jgi:hypothetical protein
MSEQDIKQVVREKYGQAAQAVKTGRQGVLLLRLGPVREL